MDLYERARTWLGSGRSIFDTNRLHDEFEQVRAEGENAEKERCAKICDDGLQDYSETGDFSRGYDEACMELAERIRAAKSPVAQEDS